MTEIETIEAEVAEELLPAVRETAAVNLFGDTNPVTVIQRATEVANALAGVIESKKLYALIRGKKHVTLEGWTLLGSMLGVFPVPVWSKPVDGGWEARVEARTRDGAVVGAAEALCLRAEGKPWDKADEYAVRSMAQTRAASKALRLPLGFVMTLGGYEATPESEMPRDASGVVTTHEGYVVPPDARIPGPQTLALPKTWAKVTEMVSAYDETTHDTFMKFAKSASKLQFGSADSKELTTEERKEALAITARAALALREAVDPAKFPPPTIDDIRKAWTSVLDGQELAIEGEE